MPANIAKRVKSKISDYATNPASQVNNVVKLQGRDGYRLRVGNYRVIMIDGEVLDILDIDVRGNIYK